MTDTITTAADANVTDQAIGTLEYVDPSRLEIGDNVRDDAALGKEFLASVAENGVLRTLLGHVELCAASPSSALRMSPLCFDESHRALRTDPVRGRIPKERHGMTYMGHDYYPQWLDNLADDVTFEAAAMDGTAHGAADARSIVVTAKELYEDQQFSYAGPCGDNGFLELYTTEVRGVPTRVVVVVTFNDAGQTQQIVVNHRPRSALLSFSRVMLEKFTGTPLAQHWEGTP